MASVSVVQLSFNGCSFLHLDVIGVVLIVVTPAWQKLRRFNCQENLNTKCPDAARGGCKAGQAPPGLQVSKKEGKANLNRGD